MSTKRYKPEQVVNLLRQNRSGDCQREDHAASLPGCSDHGADVLSLAEGVWRAEARPSEAAEGTREGELSVKRLVAELSLEKQVLRDVAQGNL